MSVAPLEFERPVLELEKKLEDLKRHLKGHDVDADPEVKRISMRIGCFCNPGVGETAEGLTEADMRAGIDAGLEMTLPLFVQIVQHRGGKSAGAMRISIGLVSNFDDVLAFLRFVASFRDQSRLALGSVTFEIESCRAIRDGS